MGKQSLERTKFYEGFTYHGSPDALLPDELRDPACGSDS